MRRVRFHTLFMGTLALVAGGIAAAQAPPGALLNAVEVQQLVKRGEPGDQARLAAHFTVLANRYTAEAKKHTLMSEGFSGNPNRPSLAGSSMHCKRLAELNTQAAATVRELATYHEQLAAGVPATAPPEGAPFEGGAGAPAPTAEELHVLAEKAMTPADHLALAEYFQALATRYAAAIDEHTAMAETYRGTRIAHAAVHCDRLVSLSRDEAKEATAAAEMHRQLANVGR